MTFLTRMLPLHSLNFRNSSSGPSGGDGREPQNLPRVNYSQMNTAGLDESLGAIGGVPPIRDELAVASEVLPQIL